MSLSGSGSSDGLFMQPGFNVASGNAFFAEKTCQNNADLLFSVIPARIMERHLTKRLGKAIVKPQDVSQETEPYSIRQNKEFSWMGLLQLSAK